MKEKPQKQLWNVTVRAHMTVRSIEAADRREACIKALQQVPGNAVVLECWKVVDEEKLREAHKPKPAA